MMTCQVLVLGPNTRGVTPWLRYYSPLVLSAEGDLAVRPRREPWISDKVVGVGHVQASTGEQLAFSLGLDGHFASNDGVYAISWLDILVTGIYVVIVVVLIALFPCVIRIVGCI